MQKEVWQALVFLVLEEDIYNDFCLKHLHELEQLPERFAEGILAKLADQAKVVEM